MNSNNKKIEEKQDPIISPTFDFITDGIASIVSYQFNHSCDESYLSSTIPWALSWVITNFTKICK